MFDKRELYFGEEGPLTIAYREDLKTGKGELKVYILRKQTDFAYAMLKDLFGISRTGKDVIITETTGKYVVTLTTPFSFERLYEGLEKGEEKGMTSLSVRRVW